MALVVVHRSRMSPCDFCSYGGASHVEARGAKIQIFFLNKLIGPK